MRSFCRVVFALGLMLVSAGRMEARAVRMWSAQELFDASDLVVIATPAATRDTAERGAHPGFANQPSVGVETSFAISAVLKGDKSRDNFVLHHYRADTNGFVVPNGPMFLEFPPVGTPPSSLPRAYLLFLRRENDGRYASVVGQMDPGFGLKDLGFVLPPTLKPTNVVFSAVQADVAEAVYQNFLAEKRGRSPVYGLAYGADDAPLPADFMGRFRGSVPRVLTGTNDFVSGPGSRVERGTGREVVILWLDSLSLQGTQAEAHVRRCAPSTVTTATLRLTLKKGRWKVTERKEGPETVSF